MPGISFIRHTVSKLAHSAPVSTESLSSKPSEARSIGDELVGTMLHSGLREVGSPPRDFLELTGHGRKTVMRALDTKAEQLRLQAAGHVNATHCSPFIARRQSVKTYLRQKFSGGIRLTRSFQTRRIGGGTHADVYKLSLKQGGGSYAFKVFNEHTLDTIVPYQEIGNGLFFTSRQTRDMSKLHAGSLRHYWTLTEHIEPTATLASRPGLTMREQGFDLSDKLPSNYINGIRVDHGGTLRRLKGSPNSSLESQPKTSLSLSG